MTQRIDDLKGLISEGLANQTAKKLVEFFKARENSTSKEFLALNTLYSQQITSLPNHFCNINTFMSIIENTTIQLRDNKSGLVSIMLDKWSPSSDFSRDNIPMELFLDALLRSIQIRRENNWIEAKPQEQIVSPNVTDPEIFRPFHMRCMKVQSQLLHGSKCGLAIESIQNEKGAIELLPQNLDSPIDEQKEGFVVSVGSFICALLLVQVFCRYHQLPEGAFYAQVEARMKRRRNQARMSLNDEHLCRVREHKVRQHLSEEHAREAIHLFELTVLQDAKVPQNYQSKKRESSRKLVMGSHILLALVGPLNSLHDYIFLESIVLCLHMVLSLLEIKASRLKQDQIDGDMKVTPTEIVKQSDLHKARVQSTV